MPEENDKQTPKQSGQFVGCVFSALAVAFIFLAIFVFLRACS
jgi:hypothetical protein